jgi:uncharacterized protein
MAQETRELTPPLLILQRRRSAVDLCEPGAMANIATATDGLQIGMVVYCAGADPNYEPFLANPVEVPLALVQRNCVVPMQVCHHFAAAMAERGRGGIILLSSAAGLGGAPNMVAYAASKAFDMVMAEALWSELHDQGVDVLSLVLGATDTPALRRLLARRGVISDPDAPIPGLATPEQVVTEGLDHLSNGPTWFAGEQVRDAERHLRSMTRSDAVRAMAQAASAGIMSRKPGTGGRPMTAAAAADRDVQQKRRGGSPSRRRCCSSSASWSRSCSAA